MALGDTPASPEILAADTEHAPPPAVSAAIAELEQLGRLSPAAVVETARDPSSPLHHCFDWDNTSAAESWRIEQARRLIRSVRVVVTHEDVEVRVPRYVRDTACEPERQGYVTFEQLQREPENARKLLVYEFERASTHVLRAVEIAHGLGLSGEVRQIAANISKLLRQVK